MNRKNVIIIGTAIIIMMLAVFLNFNTFIGKQDVPVSAQTEPIEKSNQDKDIILTDDSYTKVQNLLGQLGFQLPQEPFEAPDFEIKDINGNAVRLSDYRGKPVLFNLWATWCPPCRQEMPSMEKLYQKYKDQGFTILAASSSLSNDTLIKVQDFAKEENLSFPILFDDSEAIDYSYFTQSIPTSYIIDTDGMLIARLIGAIDWYSPQMENIIEELLE